jgi:hypothetical protein
MGYPPPPPWLLIIQTYCNISTAILVLKYKELSLRRGISSRELCSVYQACCRMIDSAHGWVSIKLRTWTRTHISSRHAEARQEEQEARGFGQGQHQEEAQGQRRWRVQVAPPQA